MYNEKDKLSGIDLRPHKFDILAWIKTLQYYMHLISNCNCWSYLLLWVFKIILIGMGRHCYCQGCTYQNSKNALVDWLC